MSHPTQRSITHLCSTCTVARTFCPLPGELLHGLEELKNSTLHEKGDVVFQEDAPSHSVFIVCTGHLKLTASANDGTVLLLRICEPGDILGISEAVLGEERYGSSAIAAVPSITAAIPNDRFIRFVRSHPETSYRLTIALAEQYQLSQREAKFLGFGENATCRLARLLLEWSAARGQKAADGVHIASQLTHTEMAQSIGSTRETVTRILGSLAELGILDRTADEIIIHKVDDLAAFCRHG